MHIQSNVFSQDQLLFVIAKSEFLRNHYYTLKNAGLFFLPKCWVQLVGSFYWVVFNIFTQVLLGYFFNPNAGFSLLGHFIGLFFIFLPRCWVVFLYLSCWVIFNTGLFFSTQTAGLSLSDETTQLLSYSQSTGFLRPTRESGSQCHQRRFGALLQRNKGLYTFYFISFKSLLCCKLYYYMQCNIRMSQSAASAAVVSLNGNTFYSL